MESRLKNSSVAVLVTLVTAFSSIALAQNKTPDYYRCENRVGGEWNYGRAPAACDAGSFGSDSFVYSYLSPAVFYDALPISDERPRYVDELNALIREAATRYIKLRNSSVSDAELTAWVDLVKTTASHESYWSHFRVASDSRLKLMRGDLGTIRKHLDSIESPCIKALYKTAGLATLPLVNLDDSTIAALKALLWYSDVSNREEPTECV